MGMGVISAVAPCRCCAHSLLSFSAAAVGVHVQPPNLSMPAWILVVR
jgi:hypothetical protein